MGDSPSLCSLGQGWFCCSAPHPRAQAWLLVERWPLRCLGPGTPGLRLTERPVTLLQGAVVPGGETGWSGGQRSKVYGALQDKATGVFPGSVANETVIQSGSQVGKAAPSGLVVKSF